MLNTIGKLKFLLEITSSNYFILAIDTDFELWIWNLHVYMYAHMAFCSLACLLVHVVLKEGLPSKPTSVVRKWQLIWS
jgi:hypothetical protein